MIKRIGDNCKKVGAFVLIIVMVLSVIPFVAIDASADTNYTITLGGFDTDKMEVTYIDLSGDDDYTDVGSVEVPSGSSYKVTVTSKDGYAITSANGFTYDNGSYYKEINEIAQNEDLTVVASELVSVPTHKLNVHAGGEGNTVVNGIIIAPNSDAALDVLDNAAPSILFTPNQDRFVSSFAVDDVEVARTGYSLNGTTGEVTGELSEITEDTNLAVGYSEIEEVVAAASDFTCENSYYNNGTLFIKNDNTPVTIAGKTIATGAYSFDGLSVGNGDTIDSFYVNDDTNTFLTNTKKYVFNDSISVVKDNVAPTVTCGDIKENNKYIWRIKTRTEYNVTVNASDEMSGISKVEWDDNEAMTSPTTISPQSAGKYTFTVSDFSGNSKSLWVRATDKVGNTSTIPIELEKDNVKPQVATLSVDNKTTTWGKFIGSSTIKADYTVTDDKGLKRVTLVDPDGVEIDHNDVSGTSSDGSFTFVADKGFNGVVKAGGECDVSKFKIVVTDAADNDSDPQGLVVTSLEAGDKVVILDNASPTVSLSPRSEGCSVTDNNVYVKGNSDGEFTVEVKDPFSGINNIEVDVVDPDNKATVVKNLTEDFSDSPKGFITNNTDEQLDEPIDYTFTTSGIDSAAYGGTQQDDYCLRVKAKDCMGNELSDYYVNVTRDKNAPNVNSINASNVNPENINEHTQKSIYNNGGTGVNYVAFDNTSMDIEIKATDDKSGVKCVTIMNESGSVMTDVNGRRLEKIAPIAADVFKVTISSYKGKLQVKIYDNVENEKTINTEKIITESAAIHNNENHINISLPETNKRDINGNNLYNTDVPVNVTVTDTYSGIERVSYEVTSPYDTFANQNVYNVTGWSESHDNNIVTIKNGVINVSNNSNDVNVKVTVVDNAGNVTAQEAKFSIDKTAPNISVAYDNYTDNGFYNSPRTAIVTVKERNFDANSILTNITNTDGVIPVITGWSGGYNIFNPDESEYTAFITYGADGDYNTTIFGSDSAGNGSNVITNEVFTVDMTRPGVDVSFDNNNSLNDRYFATDRTATITIFEHNFDPSRVSVNGRATLDGAPIGFPEVSGWTNEGDVHRAVVQFSGEGDYEFDVDVADLATNAADTYRQSSFAIDKTVPTITITGVTDKSSNSKAVAPVVTINDVNYDNNNVQITLTGAKNGASSISGGFSDITNGQTYIYPDFPTQKEVDDIYTLRANATDKAGNHFESFITFSVNRFGSIYQFDETLNQINGKYVNEALDVVFSETNVDTLVQGKNKLNLSVNGQPKTLNAGTDYTVAESGGDGSWKVYTYTLPKELFKTDGVYIVSSYSEDNAGNINENTANDKNAIIQFAVDKTAPQVVFENLKNDESYNDQEYEARMSAIDNILLSDVEITVDGDKVETTQEGDEYVFTIPEKASKQDIKATVRDAAGNVTTETAEGVVITTNAFVRLINNTWAMIGIIAGLVVVGGVTTLLVLRKKHIIK